MLHIHHYANMSVNFLSDGTVPIYDGGNFYIAPHHSVVVVPCNSDDPEHHVPGRNTGHLISRTGFMTADKAQLILMYLIDNTSDVGLLVKHGDQLGPYYTGPHGHIKAERAFMLVKDYMLLLADQNQYWLNESAIAEEYVYDNDDEIENESEAFDKEINPNDNNDAMPILNDLTII